MKKLIVVGGVLLFALAVTPAFAAKFTVGNDANARPIADTYSNFVIVDTNNPSDSNGFLDYFKYYAANKNSFRFLLVDSANKVRWISKLLTPEKIGENKFDPRRLVRVRKDWNVGLYFASTGTIPFEYKGAPAWYRSNNSYLPAVGDVLTYEGSSGRTYSFVAYGKARKCEAASKVTGDIGFNTPYGFVDLSFNAHAMDPVKGFVYWKRSAPYANWWYGHVVEASVDDNSADFTVRVKNGTPAAVVGCDITFQVVDNGEPGIGKDTVNITEVENPPGLTTCGAVGQIQGPYIIDSGNIQVHD